MKSESQHFLLKRTPGFQVETAPHSQIAQHGTRRPNFDFLVELGQI